MAADKVPGFYAEQKFRIDMESEAMQAVTIGVTIAYRSNKIRRLPTLLLDFFPF